MRESIPRPSEIAISIIFLIAYYRPTYSLLRALINTVAHIASFLKYILVRRVLRRYQVFCNIKVPGG